MRAYILGIEKTGGKGLDVQLTWSANLTRDPATLKVNGVNVTAPGVPDVHFVPADPQRSADLVYTVELPRISFVDAQDPSGFAARSGALAGRSAPAISVVVLGTAASAIAGMSGAVAAPIDALPAGVLPTDASIPGYGAAAPSDLSGVGRDSSEAVAIAHEVLFGAQPAPVAPSQLERSITAGGVLRPGAEGPEVTELQRRLGNIGFPVRATGSYDADTVEAVRAFQRAYRAGADGNFGPTSLDLMKAGERVTDPGRQGVGTVWVDGRATGHVDLLYINGKPVTVDAANALRPMFVLAARARQPVDLEIVSGYRTYEQQADLYADYLAHRGNLAAPAGYSNHHSGIAVDLNTSSPGVYRWLRNNARDFGFIRTVPSEKWHWEYRPDLTGR